MSAPFRRPLIALPSFAALIACAVLLLQPGTGAAHPEDARQAVAVPTAVGQTQVVNFSGTVAPGANEFDDCDGGAAVDKHTFDIQVAEGTYEKVKVFFTWRITWKTTTPSPETSDLQMNVINPALPAASDDDKDEGSNRTVGSSNNFVFGNEEAVTGSDLQPATYEALVCPFNNAAPQPYSGTLTIRTEPVEEPSLPSAPARGLEFGPTILADPQRRETEPLIEIDDNGNSYTCGPSGVTSTEYAQVSTDGGDQFNPLGEGPQYRPTGIPGGGDCGMTPSPFKNAAGQYPLALTGLGPLTNFVTAVSEDTGRTLSSGNSNSIPGVDRQWMTFVDPNTVLLSYNQQPRQIVVQRSLNRGLTYETQPIPASPLIPLFPGPMRSLPEEMNPAGPGRGRVAYFAFDDFLNNVYLSVSTDKGLSWKHCLVAKQPGRSTLFATADHDREGNIYVAYGENSRYHSYVTALTRDKLAECNDPISTVRGAERRFSTKNPGFSKPVQVDRGALRTTVFPWVTAGGEPGRVAVGFYGTETDGNPDLSTFKATWHVYVSQTLDLLKKNPDGSYSPNEDPAVSQVRATTHPFHYDSICLGGTGCETTGGDRSNADFFAIDYNPRTKRIQVAYNQTYKRPDDTGGQTGLTSVVTQRSGPSLGGGDVATDPRPVVRDASDDPPGDAPSEYSSLAPTPRSTRNEASGDFLSAQVGPEVDPETGARVPDGGVSVTLKLADLSARSLADTMSATRSQSLLWVWRFANGYRTGAASARYNGTSFSFGFNGYQRTGVPECLNSTCQVYRGEQAIKGKVDQATGTIVLSIPRDKLRALEGPEGHKQRPAEVPAVPGSRFYDGTAFSFGNVLSSTQERQGFMFRFDNTPAMDFVLPGAEQPRQAAPTTPPPRPQGGPPPGKTPAPACRSLTLLRGVAVRPQGRGARLVFEPRVPAPVDVDVFQQSVGRRVIGERLVARFRDRKGSFTWNGRANVRGRTVRDGYFFVRYRARTPAGKETRRVALRRVGGKLTVRPRFTARETCRLISRAKLARPVFGGRTGAALRVAVRTNRDTQLRIEVFRGRRLVQTLRSGLASSSRTVRVGLPSRVRQPGDYAVRVTAGTGARRQVETLIARRL